jgi:uncharacterized protein YndB with AHSA1/START domain
VAPRALTVPRLDRASRVVEATPREVYAALLDADALVRWLPPDGMTGEVADADLREGGGFSMTLTYEDPSGIPGKTTADTDVSRVEILELEDDRRVVWGVDFESEDEQVSGRMRMTWSITEEEPGTRVAVDATDVPPGIDHEVHQQGLAASLANLARYVEAPA